MARMKVRRIRYVAPYQIEDTNPYIPEEERPRMVWRTWTEIGVYEGVDLRQLDGRGQQPGLQFQLRIPMQDPETGEMTDADGDRAMLRIVMVGAEARYWRGVTVKGFVSKADLLYEEKYRKGDLDGCLSASARYDLDNEYVAEEWQEWQE